VSAGRADASRRPFGDRHARFRSSSRSASHFTTKRSFRSATARSLIAARSSASGRRSGSASSYEIEAARECWSVRQLERQIGAQLFERLTKDRNPEEVRALARRGQEVATPADVIKDPFVLEFLDLGEPAALRERDLEQAIIDRLEEFLLELGKGGCFVGRQKRLTVEGDHFYIDLVFYNRLLRCFLLIDLLWSAAHNRSTVTRHRSQR
jgi:predicted nuclease of restriction endonuclease-like (RecB) superfamily